MLNHIKLLQPLQIQKQPPIPHILSPGTTKQCIKFSRRELTLLTNSSLLLLTSQVLDPHLVLRARAEENPQVIIEAQNDQVEAQNKEISQESVAQNGQLEAQTKENPQEIEAQNDRLETQTKEIPQEVVTQNVQLEAQTKETPQEVGATSPESTSESSVEVQTKRAFLDISIDGKPVGRIVIRLNGDNAPIGTARFSDLVSGRAGISFRRKEFTKIMPNYVQHGGVRSYGVDAELASKTGRSLTNERLIEEWERLNDSPGTKNLAGTVSLIIRDPSKPPPKLKLVARQGKLVVDEEEVGVEPNGTEFTIATRDSPELDLSALVIGTVIEGMDVVEKISQVKTVQENTSSPYFRVAKLIGDKRAVVTERGFNRPYSKVTVTNCGIL